MSYYWIRNFLVTAKAGFIKQKCPKRSPAEISETIEAQDDLVYSFNTSIVSSPNVPITICNKEVYACADNGANSIAGEQWKDVQRPIHHLTRDEILLQMHRIPHKHSVE
ncbi:hypothetical protein CEXT_579921 [Caerostris extrusa]|uniref:Uncharacterized protein n=1 Tax=Caerostris extrusa TaxID=172846 RepID=A0AAV4NM62_CAEEX|nr:hypothetical protein CEXT_579921 [Caerostris extrusa]